MVRSILNKHTLWSSAIAAVCAALVLATYFSTSDYFTREIYSRDKEIIDLENRVSTLQKFIETNTSQLAKLNLQVTSLINVIANLTDNADQLTSENKQPNSLPDTNSQALKNTVDSLTRENEQLTALCERKQYENMLAWHEIYVLRNQTARLEGQITELKKQIAALQVAPAPAVP